MARKIPISKVMRRVFVEMADSAAYSKRQLQANPDAPDADFNRHRWVILENTIRNSLWIVLKWPEDEARVYAELLVLTREHHQAAIGPERS